MAARRLNLGEIGQVILVTEILGLLVKDLAVPDDGIQRRTQLVAHIREKIALGQIGFNRLVAGSLGFRGSILHHRLKILVQFLQVLVDLEYFPGLAFDRFLEDLGPPACHIANLAATLCRRHDHALITRGEGRHRDGDSLQRPNDPGQDSPEHDRTDREGRDEHERVDDQATETVRSTFARELIGRERGSTTHSPDRRDGSFRSDHPLIQRQWIIGSVCPCLCDLGPQMLIGSEISVADLVRIASNLFRRPVLPDVGFHLVPRLFEMTPVL